MSLPSKCCATKIAPKWIHNNNFISYMTVKLYQVTEIFFSPLEHTQSCFISFFTNKAHTWLMSPSDCIRMILLSRSINGAEHWAKKSPEVFFSPFRNALVLIYGGLDFVLCSSDSFFWIAVHAQNARHLFIKLSWKTQLDMAFVALILLLNKESPQPKEWNAF